MSFNSNEQTLWALAVKQKSFIPLLSSKKCLYIWQISHPEDFMRIAKLASHQLGKHMWCKDKCQEIQDFLDKNTIGQLELK